MKKERVFKTDYGFGIEIREDYICGTYYDDLSGEISIDDDYGELFYHEDGTLNHHIEYLQEAIRDAKKDAKKKLNSDIKLYKRAIRLLEQSKASIISKNKAIVKKARKK